MVAGESALASLEAGEIAGHENDGSMQNAWQSDLRSQSDGAATCRAATSGSVNAWSRELTMTFKRMRMASTMNAGVLERLARVLRSMRFPLFGVAQQNSWAAVAVYGFDVNSHS